MAESKSNFETLVRDELLTRYAESPGRKRSEVFDLLACEVALKHLDLTDEEIESGLTDGGGDGGIDGAFVFVNQELVTEDHELLKAGFSPDASYRGASVALWLIQAKEETSFKSNTMVTLSDALRSLLDLEKAREDLLAEDFSEAVLDAIFAFRNCARALRLVHPSVSINFKYVTLGDASSVARTVNTKLDSFKTLVADDLSFGVGVVGLMGAKEIWDELKHTPSYGSELKVTESFAHETDDGDRSYVTLVRLRDYLAFLTDENGTYRDYLFDGNVRHHEGAKARVNREISHGLSTPEGPEFWWLNNGVTIICSKASSQGKTFALDDVQVVNGLQTSRTIYDSLRKVSNDDPALGRHVLVRIIESDDPATINQVIRATNRQTPVREESLRATDDVQLQIERYLLSKDLYYDRRRNFYKNTGKPRAKIVSVKLMTQALLAAVHSKPEDARGRPGDYLKADDAYDTVFNEHAAIEIYLWAITAQRTVDEALKAAGVSTAERNNLRFIVTADVIRRALGYRPSAAEHVLGLGDVDEIVTTTEASASIGRLRKAFAAEMKKSGSQQDRLAKSKSFVDTVLKKR